MFQSNRGIQMCNYKKIRKELGTVNYNPTTIVLPNPKLHYDEIHQLMKKEKKKAGKKNKEPKKIDIKKMTKEEQIKKIVDISDIDITPKEEPIKEEHSNSSVEEVEEITVKAEDKQKEEPKLEENKENEENKEEGEETNPPENSNPPENKQTGGLLKKRIYVSDLSVDKDKEMFQL